MDKFILFSRLHHAPTVISRIFRIAIIIIKFVENHISKILPHLAQDTQYVDIPVSGKLNHSYC